MTVSGRGVQAARLEENFSEFSKWLECLKPDGLPTPLKMGEPAHFKHSSHLLNSENFSSSRAAWTPLLRTTDESILLLTLEINIWVHFITLTMKLFTCDINDAININILYNQAIKSVIILTDRGVWYSVAIHHRIYRHIDTYNLVLLYNGFVAGSVWCSIWGNICFS